MKFTEKKYDNDSLEDTIGIEKHKTDIVTKADFKDYLEDELNDEILHFTEENLNNLNSSPKQ